MRGGGGAEKQGVKISDIPVIQMRHHDMLQTYFLLEQHQTLCINIGELPVHIVTELQFKRYIAATKECDES